MMVFMMSFGWLTRRCSVAIRQSLPPPLRRTVGGSTQAPSDRALYTQADNQRGVAVSPASPRDTPCKTTLKLGAFYQKAHALDALPLIGIQPERDRHARGQCRGVTEPDTVHRLALMLQFQGQVFFTHQPL